MGTGGFYRMDNGTDGGEEDGMGTGEVVGELDGSNLSLSKNEYE